MTKYSDKITIDDAAEHVASLISDAVSFIEAEFYPEWEKAEKFFSGETDIPIVQGRSKVTQTTVRDAIRNLKPNIMRVFAQSPEIVYYEPFNVNNYNATAIAQVQTLFANQLFWRTGGYMMLLDSITTALLKGYAIVKVYHDERMTPVTQRVVGMSEAELDKFYDDDDVAVMNVEYHEEDTGEGIGYAADVTHLERKSQLKMETVPINEFFFDDNATNITNARVIGQRRSVTVGEAISMGIEYDDWETLDDLEIAFNNVGEVEQKKGYIPQSKARLESNKDITTKNFLLTEAYAWFDLMGLGIPQYYKFWFGGTQYNLLSYERVDDHPYAVIQIDPRPDAFAGMSIFDLLKDDQNAATSLLRATVDNAHAANNRRLAVHETLVNMRDVMSPLIGAPIRFKQAGMVQEIGVESTVGAMLPLLQQLNENANNKAGVTQAALGLDPNALQSTDKDAVKNTIALAQGQVELICRNVAETGLTVAFNKLLKLSMKHTPAQQLVEIDHKYYPVNQLAFDPTMHIKPAVGLGMPGAEIKFSMLAQILEKQEEYIVEFGLDNPIAPLPMAIRTMLDMARLAGVRNPARYFNEPTEDVVKQMQTMLQERATAEQEANKHIAELQPLTYIEGEKIKAQQADNEIKAKTRIEILKLMMNDDQVRDQLIQDLLVETAKINQQRLDAQAVQRAQAANDKNSPEAKA